MPRAVTGARFVSITLLCAPSILGTLGLCLTQAGTFGEAFVVAEVALLLFVGSAYGPLLLPVATTLLMTSDKAIKTAWTSRLAWGILAISIVSTGVSYLYVMPTVDLP